MTTTTKYAVIRSVNAGVFYGKVKEVKGDEASGTATVTMKQARRVWYWSGAATLSELATKGVSKPGECKFPAPTTGEHIVYGVCEIIPLTDEARASLDAVPVWTEHK